VWRRRKKMLSLENLHVYYGGIHALKGISLEVPEGKIVTLIGANGAGKSTTLRSISGIVSPREGRITFEGKDLTEVPAYDIVGMGIAMVPEGRRVFTNLTVLENLLVGAHIRRDSAGVQRDLEWVCTLFPRLEERASQSAGTLSGGEQQMLAVGRALMSKPRLLLMDEPSLGLAPNLVQEVFKTIRQLHDEGTTILLVEQNARAALRTADYGYILETGEIVLEGPGRELLHNDDVRKAYLGVE
jgi:branched-chain amino acid transport system ATP-binding protein